MTQTMSACGVLCSSCPAFNASLKGVAHQNRTAAAWRRIYRLKEPAENISCGGCQAPEDQLFHTCRRCKARQCCRAGGFTTCAECSVKSCALLEKAQAVWDGVPKLEKKLSRAEFTKYAKPYCGHRERLERERRAIQSRGSSERRERLFKSGDSSEMT